MISKLILFVNMMEKKKPAHDRNVQTGMEMTDNNKNKMFFGIIM